MNIHYLQHVPFENLGNIEPWAISKGHVISNTELFNGEAYPNLDNIDWLIIMGGPMNIYEDHKYPWLLSEKVFIEKAIRKGKFVMGICLGAQLIADVLGAKVYKGELHEIGWFPVSLTEDAKGSHLFNTLPQTLSAFHWHGDTFNLPNGAKHIAYSKGCMNQAFEYQKRVIALQFHMESNIDSINLLLKHCADDIHEGRYIQTKNEMTSNLDHFNRVKKNLHLFLNACENKIKKNISFA